MSQRIDEEVSPEVIKQHNAALLWAAKEGFEIIVQEMLSKPGTNPYVIDLSDQYDTPALMCAAKKGHANVVRTMLTAGVNPNTRDKVDCTALIWAAHFNCINTARELLKCDLIDVNAFANNGNTALMIAIGSCRIEIALDLLQSKDIDLKIQNNYHETVFTFLSKNEKNAIFPALLNACAKWLLNEENIEEVSTSILDSLKPYKEQLFAALMQLSDAQQLDAVKKIIEGKETTALGKVFWYGHTDIHRGRLLTVYAKYCELTKTEPEPEQKLDPILESLNSGEQIPDAKALLTWLNQVSGELLTPSILENLKKLKTPLLFEINQLPNDQALNMLKQIFDEKAPDEKNDKTALGLVFWAGHPKKDTGRLGDAYKRYLALKNPPTLADKPLAPSFLSRMITSVAGTGKEPERKVTLGKDTTSESAASRFEKL